MQILSRIKVTKTAALLKQELALFLIALSFLTRFSLNLDITQKKIEESVRYYPLVGLTLGLATVLIIYALLTLFSFSSYLIALIFVFLLAYATKALHWDGFADLGDACGAPAAKFYQALKDSRIGAFGVLWLLMGVLAELFLIANYLELLNGEAVSLSYLLPLAFAPFWGRLVTVFFAHLSFRKLCPTPQKGSLGELCVNGSHKMNLIFVLGTALLISLFLVGFKTLLASIIVSSLVLWNFVKISREQQIFNGDFLGATIIASEIAALFAILIC